jgi:superfamily II DNA/RNA helicase
MSWLLRRPLRALGLRRASTFADLGLSTDVVAAAEALGFTTPTAIQLKAIPLLAEGKAVVALASETGGGKTLAYLLPLLERLKRQENAMGAAIRRARHPRALVLTPSPELSRQVAAQLKAFAHAGLPVASCGLSQDQRLRAHTVRLEGRVDVVVATPSLLLLHRDLGHLALGDVRTVVVDEAEVLLARGANAQLDSILAATGLAGGDGGGGSAGGAGDGRQLVFASATFTAKLRAELASRFPRALVLETAGLHRIAKSAKVRWLTIESRDRYRAVADMLAKRLAARPSAAPGSTLVFCNTVSGARACEHILNEAGIAAVSCHGQLPPQRRRAELDEFVSGVAGVARASAREHALDAPAAEGGVGPAPPPPVLVATDAASRGLHLEGVTHVVMADFPKDMADFVHRAGRTARLGAPGDVSVLVSARETAVAQALRARVERGDAIEPVSAARPGSRERDARVPANRLEQLEAAAERRREPHRIAGLLTSLGAGRAGRDLVPAGGGTRRRTTAAPARAGAPAGRRAQGSRPDGRRAPQTWFYGPQGRSKMRGTKGRAPR